MSLLLAALLALPLAADPFALDSAPPPGFDRVAAGARCLDVLSGLVAVDTTNGRAEGDPLPDGNEFAAARTLIERVVAHVGGQQAVIDAARLVSAADALGASTTGRSRVAWEDAGFSIEVFFVGHARANLVVRLHAEHPTQRPVLVMGHLDVVGAQRADWRSDPFVATVCDDGYVYGRGAIDCKGPLSAEFTALLMLAAHRAELTRDVIFLATAAEEGGEPVGIERILEQAPELLGDAEFALNEGGRVRIVGDRIASVNIQTTEKIAYDVTLEAHGPGGHGSVPLPDDALAALARACARLHEWKAPARLNETTRLYFTRQAGFEGDPSRAAAMRRLVAAEPGSRDFDLAVDVLDDVPVDNAVLRAGAALTMLDGGFRTNVIPEHGTANFNLRVLPDDDVEALLDAMRAVAAEPAVTLTLDREPDVAPPVSSTSTALYRAMESAALAMDGRIVVLPFMSTGATDGAALRAHGIPTYGILPIPLLLEDELRMHGVDERAPVDGLAWAVEYVYRVLLTVAS